MIEQILVVAAHPDDETLGVGGTINKLANYGVDVRCLFVTDGYLPEPKDEEHAKFKRNCAFEAAKILGAKTPEFLGLPGLMLDTFGIAKLARLISSVIESLSPQVVYTHFSGDLNHDHQVVSHATLVAARPHRNHIVKKILCYETPSSTEWGIGAGLPQFQPIEFSILTEECIEKKLQAVKCYHTENFASPHPRSIDAVRRLSQYRGAHVNMSFAEAFMIVRNIVV